jgi:hypothetical protein
MYIAIELKHLNVGNDKFEVLGKKESELIYSFKQWNMNSDRCIRECTQVSRTKLKEI